MVIKLPKKYNAGGAELNIVKKNSDHIGGNFSLIDYEISISPEMVKHDYDAVVTFLHEAL